MLLPVEIARRTLKKNYDWTIVGGLISPVFESYRTDLLPASTRVHLCRLGTAHSDWIDVDDWESKQKKWFRTAETLENLKNRLHNQFPAINFRIAFLMSYDLLKSMTDPKIWDQSLVFFLSFF